MTPTKRLKGLKIATELYTHATNAHIQTLKELKEAERERDIAQECHGHALALAKKEIERAIAAEAQLETARRDALEEAADRCNEIARITRELAAKLIAGGDQSSRSMGEMQRIRAEQSEALRDAIRALQPQQEEQSK